MTMQATVSSFDPATFSVVGESHYSEMVREARRQRRLVDGRLTDWIVVRNRLSALSSRSRPQRLLQQL